LCGTAGNITHLVSGIFTSVPFFLPLCEQLALDSPHMFSRMLVACQYLHRI